MTDTKEGIIETGEQLRFRNARSETRSGNIRDIGVSASFRKPSRREGLRDETRALAQLFNSDHVLRFAAKRLLKN